jgi:hypothetical protein
VAAVAAAAVATGARTLGRGASPDAPRPDFVRQAQLVGPVRLALGAAGVIAAAAIDLSLATALAEAAVGAVLTIFTLVAPRGRQRPWRLRPAQTGRVGAAPWWRVLAEAMFPSTYTVAVLTGIALAFNRGLAAFLAGVLLGMGALALVYAVSGR